MTGVGRRSTALHTALRIARERCLDRLRHGRAETYSVYGDYERLSPSLVNVSLGADCLDHHAGSVRDGLLDVLEELAGSGPSDEELEWDRKRARDGLLDPASVHRTLDGHALRELMGLPVLTPAALLDEHEGLRAPDVSAALREVLATLVVVAPEDAGPRAALADYGTPPHAAVTGRRYTPRRLRVTRAQVWLDEGEDGISLTERGEETVTVRYATSPGGVRTAPRRLEVVGDDGSSIEVDDRTWSGGGSLSAFVEGRLAPGTVVPGPLYARAARLETLIESQLPHRWVVADELAELPSLLSDEEEPMLVAYANRRLQPGLLALSNRHLVFLSSGPGQPFHWQAPLARIEIRTLRAGVPYLGGSRLRVRSGREEVTFTGIAPRRQVAALRAELHARGLIG